MIEIDPIFLTRSEEPQTRYYSGPAFTKDRPATYNITVLSLQLCVWSTRVIVACVILLNIFFMLEYFCENQIFLKKIHITSVGGDTLSWSHGGQLRSYLLSYPVAVQCTVHRCTVRTLVTVHCTPSCTTVLTAATELL